jgi:predicted amidophosphoribosyltransferase
MSDDLHQRREQLSRQLAELQWDLGGIAYEMAIRDHFRLDVLSRQAAKLQQVNAELAEVERMLTLGQAGAAGACGSCGALYAQGSAFCRQCGKQLIEPVQAGNATTAVPPVQ